MPTTTKLDERLREIAAGLTREIAGIVCELTVDELLALSSVRDDHAVEAREEKPRPKTRRKARPEPQAASDQTLASIRVTFPRRGKAGMGASSTVSTSIRHSPQGDGGPPPKDRAAAFLRSERERLETAVLKFVALNPGADAEIVAVRVGLQKGKAQAVLDDLVLKGRLRMKSGQHGRCYVGVGWG